MFWAMLGMAWLAGLLVRVFYGPTAVGEILAGVLLGPTYLDLVPFSNSLQEIGRLGLGIVLFDAALRVEVGYLTKARTLRSVALISATPAVLAGAVMYATHKMPLMECVAGGCTMLGASTACALALAEFPDNSRQGKDLRKEIPAVAFLLDAAAFTAMAIITSLSAAMPLAGTGVAWWWWPVQSALVSVLILNIALGMRVFFTPFITMCLKVPLRSAPPNSPGRPSAPPA